MQQIEAEKSKEVSKRTTLIRKRFPSLKDVTKDLNFLQSDENRENEALKKTKTLKAEMEGSKFGKAAASAANMGVMALKKQGTFGSFKSRESSALKKRFTFKSNSSSLERNIMMYKMQDSNDSSVSHGIKRLSNNFAKLSAFIRSDSSASRGRSLSDRSINHSHDNQNKQQFVFKIIHDLRHPTQAFKDGLQ